MTWRLSKFWWVEHRLLKLCATQAWRTLRLARKVTFSSQRFSWFWRSCSSCSLPTFCSKTAACSLSLQTNSSCSDSPNNLRQSNSSSWKKEKKNSSSLKLSTKSNNKCPSKLVNWLKKNWTNFWASLSQPSSNPLAKTTQTTKNSKTTQCRCQSPCVKASTPTLLSSSVLQVSSKL